MSIDKSNVTKKVLFVLFITLLANLAVSALKISIGAFINSSSMMADGWHSLSDATSNIVGMISVKFASAPEDHKHPYGHGKIESLASIAVASLLVGAGIQVISGAIQKIANPEPMTITTASLIAMVGTLVVNIFVATYEASSGRKLNSGFLQTDAAHTKSDIFTTIGVLAGLVGMKLGLPIIIDALISIVVAFFIFHAAWEILSDNSNILLDASVIDTAKIKECVCDIDGVGCVHEIRSRGNRNMAYIEMHIEVNPEMTIAEGHELSHRIETHIQKELLPQAQVLIHLEPLGDHLISKDKLN